MHTLKAFIRHNFTETKIAFMATVCAVLLVIAATPVRAATTPWFNPTVTAWFEAMNKIGAGNILASQGTNFSGQNDLWAALGAVILGQPGAVDANGNATVFNIDNSAIAYTDHYIASLYANPPADLALWVHDTGETLGFIPRSAYAQGIGFSGLQQLLPLWKVFRNIAYFLLALIMVVIGFMVMFRKKIDPKTVVTVQNALPQIVITLILITFSYAIVGLLIDVMYLLMLVTLTLLQSASGGAIGSDTATSIISGNFGNVIGGMFSGGWKALDDIVALIPGGVAAANVLAGILAALTVKKIGVTIAGFTVGGPAIIFALVALSLLFSVLRILVMLINAYIQIILALIFSPLQLLMGAFPGSNAFEGWIKNLVANLLVFPVTGALIMIGTILASFENGGIAGSAVNSPTALWTPPLLGTSGTHGVAGIIGLGLLFSIPNIVNSIKEAMKAKPMVNAGAGSLLSPISTVWQTGQGVLSSFYYTRMLFPQKQGGGGHH